MKLAVLLVSAPAPLVKMGEAVLSNLSSGMMVRLSIFTLPERVVAKTFLSPASKGDNFRSSK